MRFRFLHAADIHLDSPMAGMTRRDPALAALTARSTRAAFTNLIDAAISQDADFLLIAGDLYDTEHKDYETGLFFAREMQRLARPCLMIHGNHDSASMITRTLKPPPNVHILASRKAETVMLLDGAAAVHGQSFAARAEMEDLAARYPAPVPGAFNIGLLHSSLENPGEHATYAPCRIETLINKGYDYWALGHIHTRATLHEHPHIHFPGNTQGRHVREPGWRGATLVEVVDGALTAMTPVPTETLRWAVIEVDLDGAVALDDALTRIRFALDAAWLGAEGRPLIARIVLGGRTALHGALVGDPAAIEAECLAAAAAIHPDLAIERVKLATRPAEAVDADYAALEAAVRGALEEAGVAEALLKDFAALRNSIPRGAEAAIPSAGADIAALQDDAWSIIRHALSQP